MMPKKQVENFKEKKGKRADNNTFFQKPQWEFKGEVKLL